MVRLIEEDFAEEFRKRFLLTLIASADGGHCGHHNVAAAERVELGRSGLSCQHAHDRIEHVCDYAQFPQEPVLPELVCRLLPQRVCGHNDQDAITARFDGDGQHDPTCIYDLINPVQSGTADITIGSRFLISQKEGLDWPAYRAPVVRMIGMRLFSAIATFFTGQKVTDPTSGYQAMNRKAFHLLAGDKFPIDYPDADVIIMLHRAGFRIKEVPVRMFPSPDDKSMHSGLKPLYYIFKMFLSIIVTLLRR